MKKKVWPVEKYSHLCAFHDSMEYGSCTLRWVWRYLNVLDLIWWKYMMCISMSGEKTRLAGGHVQDRSVKCLRLRSNAGFDFYGTCDVVHSTSLPFQINPTVQYRLEQVNTGVVISLFQGHFVILMLLITLYPCMYYRFINMWLGRQEVLSK